MLVSSLLALSLSAAAAPSSADILGAIESSSGWSTPKTSSGVSVSTKSISGMDTPSFRGTRTVDVSCDAYFSSVSDPSTHKKINNILRESGIIRTSGDVVTFYQVIDLPFPITDRYWIVQATNQRNVGGVQGRHRQTWRSLPKDTYPTVRDAVEDKYGAVFTEINYGVWELEPVGSSQCAVTYAVVNDPGGNIPGGAGSWASEKSLPHNINSFYEAAK